MKKCFEIGIQFLVPSDDHKKPKIIIKTFHIRRGCIEDAVYDGLKNVRSYLDKSYPVYKLEDFSCEEVYYHD